MGIIICEKHGDQGIVLVCDHVRHDMLTGSSTIDCVITGQEVVGDFGKEVIAFTVGYCETCAKQYELPLHGGVLAEPLSDDSPSEFSKQVKPVCSECFTAFKKSLEPCKSE